MPAAPTVVLALVLQLAFALLPGDGWVVCLGGGTAHRAEDAHDGPCRCRQGEPSAPCDERAPVHRGATPDDGDCDGVHLQRSEVEEWTSGSRGVPAPPRVALPCTLAALFGDGPAHADRERAGSHRSSPRGSPPPRTALVELGTIRIQR